MFKHSNMFDLCKYYTSTRNSNSALLELILSIFEPFERSPKAADRSFVKSNATSLMAKSTSKGEICSRKINRCLIRNNCPLIAP